MCSSSGYWACLGSVHRFVRSSNNYLTLAFAIDHRLILRLSLLSLILSSVIYRKTYRALLFTNRRRGRTEDQWTQLIDIQNCPWLIGTLCDVFADKERKRRAEIDYRTLLTCFLDDLRKEVLLMLHFLPRILGFPPVDSAAAGPCRPLWSRGFRRQGRGKCGHQCCHRRE